MCTLSKHIFFGVFFLPFCLIPVACLRDRQVLYLAHFCTCLSVVLLIFAHSMHSRSQEENGQLGSWEVLRASQMSADMSQRRGPRSRGVEERSAVSRIQSCIPRNVSRLLLYVGKWSTCSVVWNIFILGALTVYIAQAMEEWLKWHDVFVI